MLAFVLGLSLLLRVWGSRFGLPAYTRYHPDEHALVERAAAILWTGDWNLHRFNYPPFYAYIQSVGYMAHFLWGAAQGQWNQVVASALPQQYLVGRWITAFFGTLTILVVYVVARQHWTRKTGLSAAALMGGCYLHIIHSHYATFDVMVAFLAALTLLFSQLMVSDKRQRWYFLAGLCAGLAGATKYNGALVVVVPLAAHAVTTRWRDWAWLGSRLWLGVGGFVLGFLGGNPFALGNLPEFLNGLATVLHHYGTEQPGFEGASGWRWYLRAFLTSADSLWFTSGVVGLVALVAKDIRKGLVLISFPVTYFLLVSRFVVRFERNMVPLLPFLALGGGWLVGRATQWLATSLRRGPRFQAALEAGGVALLLAPSVSAAILFDSSLAKTDIRQVAGEWVEQNVEWGSKIAIEHYSIPFEHLDYRVQDVMRITDYDLAWYQGEAFDVLIISDGVWEILSKQPEKYRQKLDVYRELTDGSTLLAEFVPEPPRLVVAGYPTVAVYHFAPVRIYEVPR